jgi:hypothetical protein
MARRLQRLTALAVSRAKGRGYLADGGGLYLQISPSGAKSWVFRFRDAGRLREMGLGPVHTVPLVKARQKAHECRNLRLDGLDPIGERRAGKLKAKLEAARFPLSGEDRKVTSIRREATTFCPASRSQLFVATRRLV